MSLSISQTLIWISISEIASCEKRDRLRLFAEEVQDLFDNLESYRQDLEQLGKDVYERLLAHRNADLIDDFLQKNLAQNVKVVTYYDDDYPQTLKDIPNPPIALYCKGDIELLNKPSIAVVGPREATDYGIMVAKKFVETFAKEGLSVVSGIARGIDTVSHRTALDNKGKTVAVLPCGQDVVYPAENYRLYDLVADYGLRVTEYPLGTKVKQYTFVERNRIISGIANALFLPEAAENSGTMITVGHALQEGKPIYVVPGSVFSKTSKGSNKLILQGDGIMILSPEDVLKEMGITAKSEKPPMQLSLEETAVLDALEKGDTHFESILSQTGLSSKTLSVILLKLELEGMIRKSAGNYYSKY